MPLSDKAQEVLNVLEEVRDHVETEKHLEEDDVGTKWLPMDNICNGHVEATEKYKALMLKLNEALCGNLINDDGHHSNVYYELKRAGYSLRTGEQDSFGPLSAIVHCPNSDWIVCYG